MQPTASWRDLVKASLAGVLAAWLIYAVVAAFDTYGGGPSNDIAMAFYPVATMIALVVALLLFWPLTVGMARLGTTLGGRQGWAREWWAWAAVGAAIGAVSLMVLMGILSSWSAENALVAGIGSGMGAVSALVTHWRLGVARIG